MEDFERWEKISEWRGYTLKALEDVNYELKEIKSEIRITNDKIDKVNDKMTVMQIKVAAIGGTSGILASIVLWLITRI